MIMPTINKIIPVTNGIADNTPAPAPSVINERSELPAEYGIMQAKPAIRPIRSILIEFLSSVFAPPDTVTLDVSDLAMEYR